ncbi:Alpha/beta hydrolase fold-1 [Xylariales sp. PMI_506]|nr:Alpha/beta hydrolase fold-1 [Xylariales sp. PMI_506]
MIKPTIVFAPGAWHLPDCFDNVRQRLEVQGWPTEACRYPSVGAEPPTKGLLDDTQALITILDRLIVKEAKKVVLVVHSYGGLVGANAAKGFAPSSAGGPGGIILFVYMAAFVTPEKHSLFNMLGHQWLPWMRIEGERIYPDTPEEVFYHDVEPELQRRSIESLKHESKQVFLDPVDYEPWKDIQCMYLFADDDRGLPLALQHQLAATLGSNAIHYHVKASHSPFLSKPDDVVKGIIYGVSEVKKARMG